MRHQVFRSGEMHAVVSEGFTGSVGRGGNTKICNADLHVDYQKTEVYEFINLLRGRGLQTSLAPSHSDATKYKPKVKGRIPN